MLAQNFKTAAELRLSDKQRNTLISVLGMLERNEIPHYPLAINFVPHTSKLPHTSKPTGFNMASIFGHADCGTSACLLGWAKFISRDDSIFHIENREIDKLFFGTGISSRTTPAEAAIALRGYLTTGKADWNEALNRAGTT